MNTPLRFVCGIKHGTTKLVSFGHSYKTDPEEAVAEVLEKRGEKPEEWHTVAADFVNDRKEDIFDDFCLMLATVGYPEHKWGDLAAKFVIWGSDMVKDVLKNHT